MCYYVYVWLSERGKYKKNPLNVSNILYQTLCLYATYMFRGWDQYYETTGLVKFTNSGFCVCLNQGNRFHSGWHNELLTTLEVSEGSDFPRFRECIRTRLDISDDACPAVCWRLVGSRRYFPAKQNRRKNTEHKHSDSFYSIIFENYRK